MSNGTQINIKVNRARKLADRITVYSSGQTVEVARGNGVDFRVVIEDGGTIADLSDIATLSLSYMPVDRQSDAIATETVAVDDSVFTAEQFLAGTHQHATFSFSEADMNPVLGDLTKAYWIVCYGAASVGGGEVTQGGGTITIIEDGTDNTVGTPDPPATGITSSQAATQIESYIDTDEALTADSDSKVPSQQAVKAYVDNNAGLTEGEVETEIETYIDTDDTLAANSDTKVPSQQAVKAYVDNNAGLTEGEVEAEIETYIDTDDTLAADSDTKVPSQQAVKAYVDNNAGLTEGEVETEIETYIDTDDTLAADSDALIPSQSAIVGYVGTQIAALGTGVASAITENVTQTSHGFAVGKVIQYTGTAWGNPTLVKNQPVGVVSAVANTNTFTVTLRGIVTGLSSHGLNNILYASSTGAITTVENLWRVGFAQTATAVYVDPALVPVGRTIYLAEVQDSTTDGGSFTSGAKRTRAINTKTGDDFSLVTLASDKFKPVAGRWMARWEAPARGVSRHVSTLYNDTDSTELKLAGMAFSNSGGEVTKSEGAHEFLSVGTKDLIIQHECQTTAATNGFGVSSSPITEDSIYTQVWLTFLGPN